MTGAQLELALQVGKRRPIKRRRVGDLRFVLLMVVASFWCVGLAARLYLLQISDSTSWRDWASRQHTANLETATPRGEILDRSGRPFAVSVPAGSLFAKPKQIKNPASVARVLAKELGISERNLLKTLQEQKSFVWVGRQLPRATVDRVLTLGLPGIGSLNESKRVYPFKEAASSLIGKTSIDGAGLSGLELQFDKSLRGRTGATSVRKDALGNMIDVSDASNASDLKASGVLRLTLDAALQTIVDEELERGRWEAKAKGAIALLIDATTGDVLALSQAPTININNAVLDSKGLSNRAVEAVFEPGSMIKPLIAGLAMDRGLASVNEMIDCENGKFTVGNKTIKDVHPSKVISLRDVIIRSSNIGIAKIGMRMGPERLYDGLRMLGFGSDTRLGLPGESNGILRPVNKWARVDIATHSFGQGVAVTVPQLARAMAAVVNGGMLPRLRVVQGDSEGEGIRVFSQKTAASIAEMMQAVVDDEHGTGGKAAIAGVAIGGKTGTAQKAREDGRGYAEGKYVSGFAGFADGTSLGLNQKLALMIAVDEPGGAIYGGVVAAPIFRRIMQRVLHHLTTDQHLSNPDKSPLVPVVASRDKRSFPKPIEFYKAIANQLG